MSFQFLGEAGGRDVHLQVIPESARIEVLAKLSRTLVNLVNNALNTQLLELSWEVLAKLEITSFQSV